MKKTGFLLLLIAGSFLSGFALKSVLSAREKENVVPVRKVTGIGGIFFKCKNPAKLKDWYQQQLGLNTNQYGVVFEWRQGVDTVKKGFTQWSLFPEKTTYFAPSQKDFMINYRVTNLQALVHELKQSGVTVLDSIETYSYGKFVHILDPEDNKIELWEPNDAEYEKLGRELGSKTTK